MWRAGGLAVKRTRMLYASLPGCLGSCLLLTTDDFKRDGGIWQSGRHWLSEECGVDVGCKLYSIDDSSALFMTWGAAFHCLTIRRLLFQSLNRYYWVLWGHLTQNVCSQLCSVWNVRYFGRISSLSLIFPLICLCFGRMPSKIGDWKFFYQSMNIFMWDFIRWFGELNKYENGSSAHYCLSMSEVHFLF